MRRRTPAPHRAKPICPPRLHHHQAAVDGEDLAGDERGLVAGEEGDRGGDLLGRRRSGPSGVRAVISSLSASGRSWVSSVRTKPGRDRVDRDAARRPARARWPWSGRSARPSPTSSWPGPSGRPGPDTEVMLMIRPPLRLEHRPGDGLGHVERAEQVRLEDLAPGLGAHPHDQVVAGDAGVVDEDVDLAERLERGLDDAVGRLGRRERRPGRRARGGRAPRSRRGLVAAAAALPL